MVQKITPRTLALALEYHLFKKDKALLKPLVPPRVQAMLRRRARARYLVWDARQYNEWMQQHLVFRRAHYTADLLPGLLTIATPVWNGSPISYLKQLAESIAIQNANGACQWFVLDNGCTLPPLRHYLTELAQRFSWVTLHSEPTNLGIVGGLRTCLEQARNQYLCVVDADDLLYADCLKIVQSFIQSNGFPKLLYSDEDKIIGFQNVQPYFKADFDPVLLLNSAYIAHLGVFHRAEALALGAYTDATTEGSADWDCFIRFYLAGHHAVHIPEVIYSWRMHPESTADDAGSKPYIHSSQKAVLNRFLEARHLAATNTVEYSPLLPGSADWWIERKHLNPLRALLISENSSLSYPHLARQKSAEIEDLLAPDFDMVCLLLGDLTPQRDDCLWEAQGLFERFPDGVMVGGWIACPSGQVETGPLVLGFESDTACPDQGRPIVDPGYFTQMRKQRSVSAVTSRFSVIKTEFLREAFHAGVLTNLPMQNWGSHLGEFARQHNKRIIFSPFLRADASKQSPSSPARANVEPDHRFYPQYFGITPATAYQLKLRE